MPQAAGGVPERPVRGEVGEGERHAGERAAALDPDPLLDVLALEAVAT